MHHQQATLWHLYTNAALRREFIFDKERFYHKYNLSPANIYFLDSISINELLFCAEEILQERLIKVKKLLPLTFKLIGEDITALFFKFCDQFTSKGVHRHRQDAIQFIDYLLNHKSFSTSKRNNLYIKSVMHFESQLLYDIEEIPTVPFYPGTYGIMNSSPVLRKTQPKRLQQRFRIIGSGYDWTRERKNKRRQKKKHTTPFL